MDADEPKGPIMNWTINNVLIAVAVVLIIAVAIVYLIQNVSVN